MSITVDQVYNILRAKKKNNIKLELKRTAPRPQRTRHIALIERWQYMPQRVPVALKI